MPSSPRLVLPPDPPRDQPTKKEAWYLDCLDKWSRHHKRAPTLVELAAFCCKSTTSVYSALVALGHKGHVVQGDDRKFRVKP